MRGGHYDNLFVHFLPVGLWYDNAMISRAQPDLSVMKISAEAVRWSQRRYEASDWSQAWRSYLAFKENEKFYSLGLGQKLRWDEEPEPETFVHIQ